MFRFRKDPGNRHAFLLDCIVFCFVGATLAETAGVASLRRTIEECFRRDKDEFGLENREVRPWYGWRLRMILVPGDRRGSGAADTARRVIRGRD